ncbi:MAG: ATPase, T2SS/T4P/T4SS family [Bacilli bacterium]|nr:ATPase, T2SS/T4P/T4SS family [Bacilli bacterium]
MNENIFDKLDFGPLKSLLDDDDITDISYDNNGQIWIRSLTQGSIRVEVNGATPEFVEKLAFQCSNVMGTTFNNAKPFLDAESSELRLNFVHPSIATNGIAMVIRKTPAKIRLEKEKLLKDDYFTQDIHDILIKCVEGHCNIIVSGETGSGKTEFVKYLASHTKTNEKIITIEDTLELHLDKIFPQRDIVAMKTNNVASYTDVLVTCMRQNPKWILLSEVRSAEAVTAVRNSISSGHNILSTIHADKASAIPYRLYSLMETDLDVNQFLSTIYRYIQLGVHIRAYYSKEKGKFHREVDEVTEFYVDENNQPKSRTIYQKVFGKEPILRKPSKHLIEYLENQNIDITSVTSHMVDDLPFDNDEEDDTTVPAENTAVETKPVETEVPTENTGATPETNPVVNNETPAGNVMPIPEPAPAIAPVMPVPATEPVLPTEPTVNQEVVQTPTQVQPENQTTPAPVTGTEQPGTSQVIPTAPVLPTPASITNVPLQPEVVLPNLETVMAQPIQKQPAVTQEAQQPSVPQPVIPLAPTPEAPANVPLQPSTVVVPSSTTQVIPSVAPVIPDPLPTLDSNPGVQQ